MPALVAAAEGGGLPGIAGRVDVKRLIVMIARSWPDRVVHPARVRNACHFLR
jgi:hypothetical protein